jgi:RNA polymerase sigma-70 factor (ECF subfamily)
VPKSIKKAIARFLSEMDVTFISNACHISSMEVSEFEKLAKTLRPLLLVRAKRMLPNDEAEDMVQDTLCKLWLIRQRLGSYQSKEALAYTIQRNLILNHIRNNHLPTLSIDENPEAYALKEETRSTDEEEKKLQQLQFLISELPDTQQTILRMKHIDGLEIEEIMRITGCSYDAVRANLSRARRKIRDQFLQKTNQDEQSPAN